MGIVKDLNEKHLDKKRTKALKLIVQIPCFNEAKRSLEKRSDIVVGRVRLKAFMVFH